MEQLSLFQSTRWTVTELTRHLRKMLENDDALQDVFIQGEISNFSRPSSGHLYFTLKDSGAALKCVMWRSDAAKMRLALQDGLSIEAHGKIGVYEPGGQYQLYVDMIRPTGEGALYQEFLRLKASLEAEGLFDPERKRAIPELPRTIGIITSPTGAAIRDMLNTIKRRFPLAEVTLAPAPVQGADAPSALVLALQNLNRIVHPDVILLARGGGSIEDLWAFNDERVIRAIVASTAPVITGVGHETDFTLADFASDLRAPTPTAAAELATAITIADLQSALNSFAQQLDLNLSSALEERRSSVAELRMRLGYFSPARQIQNEGQRVDDLRRRAQSALAHRMELASAHLQGLAQRLNALSPLAVLGRGYALVSLSDGTIVHSRKQVRVGDDLKIRVADGAISAQAKE
jgi:exodeoxyribonuclease VII large subunit